MSTENLQITGDQQAGTENAATPVPGSPEFDAAIAAQLQESKGSKSEELIDGKFKSQEELLAAYKELEAKFTQSNQEQETTQESQGEQTQEESEEAPAGLPPGITVEDNKRYLQELAAGGLSAETYAELAQKGYSKAIVDFFVSSQQGNQQAAEQVAQVARKELIGSTVGSEEVFSTMSQWAATNMAPEDLASYNTLVGAQGTAKAGLEFLKAKYEAANGRPPKGQLRGGSGKPAGFSSQAEAIKAMSDERYRKDPAYREMVAQKLLNRTY